MAAADEDGNHAPGVGRMKSIRAVERAVELLRAIATHGTVTVPVLVDATGLPRPTLLRLLRTLEQQGLVRRRIRDQQYRLGAGIADLAATLQPGDLLADIAAPVLQALCEKVRWPTVIGVYGDPDPGDFMTVLESSARLSRFYVSTVTRQNVNLLMSSLGTAYLAHLGEERLAAVMNRVRGTRDVHNLEAIALGDLNERLADIRLRGYALRHPRYRGGTHNDDPMDDGLNAIAVPLASAAGVFGALNMYWNRKAMPAQEVVQRHVPLLRAAAAGLAEQAAARSLDHRLIAKELGASRQEGLP